MADVEVDKISIGITATTAQAEKGLDRVVAKVEKLSQIVNSSFGFKETSKLDDFIRSFEKLKHIGEIKISPSLAKSVVNLGYAADCLKGVDFSKVEELANAYKKLADVGNIKAPKITGVGKDKDTEVESATNEAVSKYDEMIHKNSEMQTMYDRVDSASAKYSATIRKLTMQMEAGKISEAAWLEELKRLNAELDNASPKVNKASNTFDKYRKTVLDVGGALDKVGSKALKTTANIGLMPFKKVGNDILSTTRRLNNFLSSIKRVALYRAIRTVLKEITQAFQEGTQNLYQYSKAINGEFAKSMDLLATDALYVKNSLGAMSAPIVNNLAPAIDVLTDKFVALLNVVNETVASLTGADTWTRAVKYPVEYAEATDDATKAAKKFKATILGFDEINPLNDNSNNGRGSASDALDYSKMFTEETVTTETAKWAQAVIDAWENADFTGIGEAIGEGVKSGLDNIPWEDINAKGSQFSRSLGTLINGFVEVDGLGRSFGSTIANAINFGVGTLHEFITSVHWESVGAFLGDGINGFFKDWDAHDLAETISDGILGAIMLIDGILTETDFEQVGNKIGEFIKNLKWKEILGGLGTIVAKAIKAAFEALVGIAEEDPFGAAIIGSAVVLKLVAFFEDTSTVNLVKNAIKGAVSNGLAGASTATGAGSAVEAAENAGKTLSNTFANAFGIGFAAVLGGIIAIKLGKCLADHVDEISDTATGLLDEVEIALYKRGLLKELSPHASKTYNEKLWNDKSTVPEADFAKEDLAAEYEKYITAKQSKAEFFMGYDEWLKKRNEAEGLKNAIEEIGNLMPISLRLKTDRKSDTTMEEYGSFLEYADRRHEATVETFVIGMSGLNNLNYKLDATPLFTESVIQVKVNNMNLLYALETSLETVGGTVISTAIAATKDVGLLDIFKGKLDGLNDKNVTATAQTKDVSLLDVFKTKMGALADKTVNAIAKTFGMDDVDTLMGKINNLPKSKQIDIVASVSTVTAKKSDTTNGKGISTNPNVIMVQAFASGGAPTTGELFLARESGPELVGQIGSRASVANNEQIIQGISAGVENANMEQNQLLREQNELLRQLLNKPNVASISTSSLVAGFNRMNKREGQAAVSIG